MFTGIIQEIGTVRSIISENGLKKLCIQSKTVKKELKTGGSVAVNGVCLTAVKFGWDNFVVDVMEQTLKGTGIGQLSVGDKVNLEAALPVTGKVDGHIVTGHVDCLGIIIKKVSAGGRIEFFIRVPNRFLPLVVEKGSICVEGISLTVAGFKGNVLKIAVIPHTLKNTTLSLKNPGQSVNLEFDIIGKYAISRLDRLMVPDNSSQLEAKFIEFSNFVYRGNLN